MARLTSSLGRVARRRTLLRWERLAHDAHELDPLTLRRVRMAARELSERVDKVARIADGKLALPRIGSDFVEAPLHSDWTYRPELWRLPLAERGKATPRNGQKLGDEVTLFHDCPLVEIVAGQSRNTREQDLAPFGLRLDIFDFAGSYLSLAVHLPEEGLVGLKRRHLIRLSCLLESERPAHAFVRLNIRHGPNTEQLLQQFPENKHEIELDFDLGFSNLNENRIEGAWIDIIFEDPRMNMINLRELSFSRRPRSEL